MSPTLSDLSRDLAVAVKFFQTNQDAQEMPFMRSFPKNSCERSAALLMVALARKYPDARVVYVKGRNPNNNEMHFWVEIDDVVVDPTAHQFAQFSIPLVCERPNPLEAQFQWDEEHLDPEASTDLPRNSNDRWSVTLAGLCSEIGT